MTEIPLTRATRSLLLAMQDTAAKRAASSARLASGHRVSSATDAIAYYQANDLRQSRTDLLSIGSGIDQAIESVRAAAVGIGHITRLTQQLKGLVLAASAAAPGERQVLAKQFDHILNQINRISDDTSYLGLNLIGDRSANVFRWAPDDLDVRFNASGASAHTTRGQYLGSDYFLTTKDPNDIAYKPDALGAHLAQYNVTPTTTTPNTAGAGAIGNLTQIELKARFSPVSDASGDGDGSGTLDNGEGMELDFVLTNINGAPAADVAFSNATVSTGWNFTYNTSAFFGTVAAGATITTDLGSDLDLEIPAGTPPGTPFSISMDVTADGVSKHVTFGPFTVGAITNGQTITGTATGTAGVEVTAPSAPPPTQFGGIDESTMTQGPTTPTPTLAVEAADYETNEFQVTFTDPPPEVTRALQAHPQGLGIFHSWLYRGFDSPESVDAALHDIDRAMKTLATAEARMGNNLNLYRIRAQYGSLQGNTFEEAALKLDEIDLNAEAATQLVLQTREQLALNALSMTSQGEGMIISIFRAGQ